MDTFPIPANAYQPVISGRKHATLVTITPAKGMVVRLLCGGQYQVGSLQKTPHLSDCPGCQAALVARENAGETANTLES